MILDASVVQGWGSEPAARIVRVPAATAREIRAALAAGVPVLVAGCPDDRTGLVGVPSVRRVIDRHGRLVTRVHVNLDVSLCARHAADYRYPLGPVQHGRHAGPCDECERDDGPDPDAQRAAALDRDADDRTRDW